MMTRLSTTALVSRAYSKILEIGREVIQVEGRALFDLADGLDESFADAVDLLVATKQRVIVSGMGKSGHVARKIAATLASTGTPALFVHPAEAAHGDLGMITQGDLLLILSNSGATPELRAVVQHAKRVGSSIIAVASQAASPLMKSADVRLLLPPAREACPVNIAPTTSTTLMLALGDALAVATMRVRGLTRERLQLLHPGGSIGDRLQPVETMMHMGDKLPLVAHDSPMLEVVLEMTRKSFGIAGVVEGGDLIGVITDGDLRRHSEQLFSLKARDVLTPEPKLVPEGTMCDDAYAMLQEYRITALFVTAHDAPHRPVGLVHIHDFARSRNA
ncbi:MAG: KpsF/GutQ family sugar-phosphate isomerase [Sphingomonas bacterium]|nr:KpsF/GutQ family sugar-phosphate isomerase [Sphingomonas bacterium]